MDPQDGRGWRKAPEWVERLIGQPLERLKTKVGEKLEELDQRGPDPAQTALRRADARLGRAIRLFGPDGGPTANARADVATQLERIDRLAEARLLREAVLEANRHHLGPEHLDTLTAEWWLATNLYRQQMISEAKSLAVHARDGLRLQFGHGDKRTIEIEKLLTRLDTWAADE